MASIKKIVNKHGVSYQFTISSGKGADGKQKRYYDTWVPPKGMTELKADKEANKQAYQFEERVKSGNYQDPNITFADFARKWHREYAEKQLKPKTYVEYEKMFPRIFEAIGHKKLGELRTGHINSFYSNLQEKGMNLHSQKVVGRSLKETIKGKKLTIQTIAKDAGLSEKTISAAWNGKIIEKESAEKIAKVLGLKFSECFTAQEAKYLSPASVRSNHRLISSILTKAVKWGYIPINPAINAELPKLTPHEAQYLEEAEAKHVLDLLLGEPLKYQYAITFDLLSGLRRGELCGLRWTDVDFDAETIQVKETRAYISGMGVITDTPKNATSSRPLRLSGSVFVLLRNIKQWQDEQEKALGNKWKNSDGHIFVNEEGAPLYPDSLTKWFTNFIKKNGITKATVHSLRHTYASLMIANGTPLIVVSKRLGHAQLSTTGNIYAHMIRSAEEKALEVTDVFDEQILKIAK